MRKRSGCLIRGGSAALIAATALSGAPAAADTPDRMIARRIELAFMPFAGDRIPTLQQAVEGSAPLIDRVSLNLVEAANPQIPETRAAPAGPVAFPVRFDVAPAYDVAPRLEPEVVAALRTAEAVAILPDAVQQAAPPPFLLEKPFAAEKPVVADEPADRPPSPARKPRAAPAAKRVVAPVAGPRRPKAQERPRAIRTARAPVRASAPRPAPARAAIAAEPPPSLGGHARSFSPKMSAAGPAQTVPPVVSR